MPIQSLFTSLSIFFGAKLSSFRSEWSFLRDNSSPSAQSLTLLCANCLSVLTSLRKILSCQDWRDFVFTSKNCYSILKEKSSSLVIHRYWVSFLIIGFNLDRHWSLVRDGFCENFKNVLLWLIILRAAKVRDSTKNWGYINSDRCASCSRKETIDHCFLNCSRVKAVWSHFSPILSCLLGATFLPKGWFPYDRRRSQTIAGDRRADCCIHFGQRNCQNYTRVVLAGNRSKQYGGRRGGNFVADKFISSFSQPILKFSWHCISPRSRR